MNNFWRKIIIQTLNRRNKNSGDKTSYSRYELAKGMQELRSNVMGYVADFVFITLGIFSAAFGFKGFLLTNHFIDGGATGISLLISALTGTPLYILLLLVNIPFIILAYTVIGKSFAAKTVLAISGLALVVATVTFPDVTKDNLLVAL